MGDILDALKYVYMAKISGAYLQKATLIFRTKELILISAVLILRTTELALGHEEFIQRRCLVKVILNFTQSNPALYCDENEGRNVEK